ncbi:MAG: ion channel [Pirellula sp.]
MSKPFSIPIARNIAEYALIVALWGTLLWGVSENWLSEGWMSLAIVVLCWIKTGFFGAENMNQLFQAAQFNVPHHHFLLLMGINMSQMIMSFAFDFHLLYSLNKSSFLGVTKDVDQWEALFDFFYLSTLNFSFFGYSDILPQTVAAKTVNLTEIVLAFVTVIFLLSDFISLKDSLRNPPPNIPSSEQSQS